MPGRFSLVTAATLGLSFAPAAAFAASGCTLAKLAELPVTMEGLKPLVSAKINGSDVRFVADSGAFFNMIPRATADEFHLRLRDAPIHVTIQGMGGSTEPQVTTVKLFELAGIPIRSVDFLVGGSDIGSGAGAAVGLIGQNVFRIADVEYDLANGVIRLMRPKGCPHSADLAYWTKPGDQHSEMDINWATPQSPHTTGTAFLESTRIKVMFDTGADRSMLDLRAAERAGIKPDSPGVEYAGTSSGIGRSQVKTWIARFKSIKIGDDEEIRNIRLRIADMRSTDTDMLIGADFFLSHRVYVANSQQKLYFSYNGGPVFNLDTGAKPATATASATPSSPAADAAPATEGQTPPNGAGEPTTAEAFARRGVAFAGRHDYEHAIADLTRACELAPQESHYFFERAQAYTNNKQPDLAKADLEQALKLKPDDVQALLARAQLRLMAHQPADAIADLDMIDRTAAKQADLRLELGTLYARAQQLPQAIAQYTLWIADHGSDAKLAIAYGNRCGARAQLGQDLEEGLSDCNRAVRLSSNNAQLLELRGLMRLRTGDYDHAISDFDATLKLNPKNAAALYGRGLAQQHKQKSAAADNDFAAAKALQPRIADEFSKHGLGP